MMCARRRGFDLSALSRQQADILVPALRTCKFPFGRIKKKAGAQVPVTVADLSRFSASLDANGHGHAHEGGREAHLLGEPVHIQSNVITGRRSPLGLYWLPTSSYPAGRIEIGSAAMASPDLAREVLLAEAAHAVDLTTMTDSQRQRISDLFDYIGGGENRPQGWFEELGEQSYWRWRGEAWMSLFISSYSDLPQPLKARQPWEWSYNEVDILQVRQILRRPNS